MVSRGQLHPQFGKVMVLVPAHDDGCGVRFLQGKNTGKCGMVVAQPDETNEVLDHRAIERGGDLRSAVIMTIDVSANPRVFQQLHIVVSGQQADVIDLRNTWQEKLYRSRQQVTTLIPPHRVK